MLIIQNTSTNPYFNIASEEFLLKNIDEDLLMLYINSPSVILGKHQNALNEINFRYVYENNIPVIRRLSGGGTVFHDHGNLNFTFIRNSAEGDLVNFRKFTRPVMEVLDSLGVDVKFEGKNDLRINGLKISGNAEHVFKNRVLHHGTLLFDSNLEALGDAIRVIPDRYIDKAVQSVRSEVTNIHPFLGQEISIQQFKGYIEDHIRQRETSQEYSFTPEDLIQISELEKNKYSTWEWTYGYSPKYGLKTYLQHEKQSVQIELRCEKSIIQEVKNLTPSVTFFDSLLNNLVGKPHKLESVLTEIRKELGLQGQLLTSLGLQFF